MKARRSRKDRVVWAGCLVLLLGALAVTGSVTQSQAESVITVTTTAQDGSGGCSLGEAIVSANTDSNADAPECAAGSGADTIVLASHAVYPMTDIVYDAYNYVGPTATPIVTSAIVIEGAGAQLVKNATANFRALAVAEGGDLTIEETHIKGFTVKGGSGAHGGGGGMGAGGAVYVHRGTLVVERSTFENNGVEGGDGGGRRQVAAAEGFTVGGGGGGLGGDGGSAGLGGGGGGGARGAGGTGNVVTCDGGFFDCAFGFGGGGGGTVQPGASGSAGSAAGGYRCGGDGAGSQYGDSGAGADCRGGGGGGGNSSSVDFDSGSLDPILGVNEGGDGGPGGYGGGGGGGAWGNATFAQGTDGGHGGFGGGGGAGGGGFGDLGGNGDFGGGGGAGIEGAFYVGGNGQGGTFAGDGGSYYGGGGAGLGGAIFGHEATITVTNSTFTGNYATRGHHGGGDSNDGRGAGGALFLVGGTLTILNSTISGNETGEFTNTDNGPVGIGGGGVVVYKPDVFPSVPTSLTLRNTIVAGNGPHECYVRNGPLTSGVGNLIVDNSKNSHDDTPCPGVWETEDPLLLPLHANPPGNTMTMEIPSGSPAIDAADPATSVSQDQRGFDRPQGAGFDIGAYEAAVIPPVTTITLAPLSPDGSNGWYRNAVGVTVAATDADGEVAQTRCVLDPASAPATFADLPDGACALSSVGSPDGDHAIYAASVDTNDNTESPPVSAAFKLDATAPTLSPVLSATTVVVGQTGVTVTPNASDVTSGLASSGCGTIDTSTPGVHTVTCTATDNAGNTATRDVQYVVEYRILGFFSPVPFSKWKVIQGVPVKVALGDAAGTRISDSEGAALATACRVRFSATGAQAKLPQCMKYDAAMNQFVYTWKLAKGGTGPATITVSVSYPGTTSTTRLSEVVMITN